MTTAQRIVICLALGLLLLMYLAPPVHYGIGYDWLWHGGNIDEHTASRNFTYWVFGFILLFLAVTPRRA